MGVASVMDAFRDGAEVIWDPVHKPRIRASKNIAPIFHEEKETLREVLRRAVNFRNQLKKYGPAPLLVLDESETFDGGCISCGIKLDSREFRCPLCQGAAWLALEMKPPHGWKDEGQYA